MTNQKLFQIFSIHGVTQTKQASELLSHGLHNIVKVEPLLPEPSGRFRVMNIFKLEVSQFKDLKDINAIQNQLQVDLSPRFFISSQKTCFKNSTFIF